MICAVDVETQGLDATKYIIGCVITERSNKPKYFRDKRMLWEHLVKLGYSEKKRNKTLYVYAHNASYDFYAYADLEDQHLKFFSHNPFIVSYMDGNNEIIKFLDTMALYRRSLKEVGDIIKLPKMDTPTELFNPKCKITDKFIEEIKPYLYRDTEICLKSVIELKKKLKKEGISVRRLMTINQIAINYFINYLRKFPYPEEYFWNVRRGELIRTMRTREIRSAYRGGRIECFRTGAIPEAVYIDCNSLYPYSAISMRFPELKSERKEWKPLKRYTVKEILCKIGLSKCLVRNVSNDLALLPVRTTTGNYYPKRGKYMIGTWTHTELEKAIKNGYEIIDIEWSVIYNTTYNPMGDFMGELYKKRFKSGNDFDKFFYKMMMNCCLGKLAQYRSGQEIVIDSIEEAEKYKNMNYEIIKNVRFSNLYSNSAATYGEFNEPVYKKPYYCPIIPTLVNAYARVYMYEEMSKIPLKDLVYTDTDSIIFTDNTNLKLFHITDRIGEFKVVELNKPCIVYGRKTIKIGDHVSVSGVAKSASRTADFDLGYLERKQMVTLKTCKDVSQCGTFKSDVRDLKDQLTKHKTMKSIMGEQELYIDRNITNLGYFIPSITEIRERLK